ncbi:unnamed protein product [Umbelopsis ramanniana]
MLLKRRHNGLQQSKSSLPLKRKRIDVDNVNDDSSSDTAYEDDQDFNGEDYDSDGYPIPKKKDKREVAKRAALAELATHNNRELPPPLPKDYNPMKILKSKFKVPFKVDVVDTTQSLVPTTRTLGVRRRLHIAARALHDWTADGSIILYDPEKDDSQSENSTPEEESPTETPKTINHSKAGKPLAELLGTKKVEHKRGHVVVDPVLAKVLRPHQIDGVKFLYRCTTGKIHPNAYGCIMADEMGLGKTLQCIALMWTLLRQSGDIGKPTIEKAIIVCPSSLVRNWANELVKWLGPNRIRPLAIDGKGTKEKVTADMKQWGSAQGRMVVNPVLIISYETLRSYCPVLKNCQIGLLLCDEGHRLKNGNSLTFQGLNSLQVQRRVILSGTPIQNDLSEYFSLLNFANPGLLGTPNEFRKNYEIPILKGRDADATQKDHETSDQKLSELWGIVSKFIIRRTNDILSKYLPVKFEHVVFCKLSPLQLDLYNVFITSKAMQKLLRGQGSQPLKAITMLKKLVNHPDLLNLPEEIRGSEDVLPDSYQTQGRHRIIAPEFSGKMMVLDRMLGKIKKETDDKIVIISNYTQSLDLIEKYCRQRNYGSLRLDGSMTINKRQKLVDRFNNPEGTEFVFLLSSKAGGCGLNLIGANRLVLFDPDWNPAADQQALARVWRDGQKKDCFIYRLITTGTIEEKIFQRQSHKQSLSSCVVDEAADTERHFSLADLRQLFMYNGDTSCDTHDTFKCKRCLEGKSVQDVESMQYGDTSSWDHYDEKLHDLPDPILQEEAGKGIVSFVFQYISHLR